MNGMCVGLVCGTASVPRHQHPASQVCAVHPWHVKRQCLGKRSKQTIKSIEKQAVGEEHNKHCRCSESLPVTSNADDLPNSATIARPSKPEPVQTFDTVVVSTTFLASKRRAVVLLYLLSLALLWRLLLLLRQPWLVLSSVHKTPDIYQRIIRKMPKFGCTDSKLCISQR